MCKVSCFYQKVHNFWLCCSTNEADSIQTKLSRFLMNYHTTPNTTTGVTPSELFLGRRMKTRLDILRLNLLPKVTGKQTNQKMYHDVHSGVRQFTLGQKVLVENVSPKSTEARRLPATVLEKMGAVSYKVLVHNRGVWKRYADQIVVHHSSTGSHESSASEDVDIYVHGGCYIRRITK